MFDDQNKPDGMREPVVLLGLPQQVVPGVQDVLGVVELAGELEAAAAPAVVAGPAGGGVAGAVVFSFTDDWHRGGEQVDLQRAETGRHLCGARSRCGGGHARGRECAVPPHRARHGEAGSAGGGLRVRRREHGAAQPERSARQGRVRRLDPPPHGPVHDEVQAAGLSFGGLVSTPSSFETALRASSG